MQPKCSFSLFPQLAKSHTWIISTFSLIEKVGLDLCENISTSAYK